MKLNIKNELLFLNIIVFALIAFVLFSPDSPLRIILGIPVAVFLPGYALLAALFPRKTQISGIERVIFSFVLSLAVVPLIALIFNFTPLGVELEAILYATSGFIVLTSIIAWLRRWRLTTEERFKIELKLTRPIWNRQTTVGSVVLMVIILGAVGVLAYLASNPQPEDAYTEFYTLPATSEDLSYLRTLFVGQEAEVRVGIESHELTVANYQIDVLLNDSLDEKIETSLMPGGKFLQMITLVFDKPGLKQKVEFILYKDGVTYMKSLYLWIDVKP